MNKIPKGVSTRKALPFRGTPLPTFDSSDVTSLTKIESSLNSSVIDHLSRSFSIKEYTVLGRTAPAIMFDVVRMSHSLYLTFYPLELLPCPYRDQCYQLFILFVSFGFLTFLVSGLGGLI